MTRARRAAILLALVGLLSAGVFGQGSVTYVYDELGRLVGVIDQTGAAAIYTYDTVGNLLSIARPAASSVSIIEFTPNSGTVGATVTIYGTGFSTTPAQNTVTFNGTAAPVTASTTTRIDTTVPAGTTTGAIGVTTPTGSATTSASFTVTAGATPTITSFTPGVGDVGAAVTIAGTNFATSAANNNVVFNQTHATVASATAASISTSVPPQGRSGALSVATPAGKAIAASDFFVPPAPYTAAEVGFTGRMTFGESKTLTLSAANKIGMVVFSATAGQRVSVKMSAVTITSSYLYLYRPDYTILATQSTGTGGAFMDTQTLPASGVYTLLLNPDSTYTGNLTVTLYDVPPDVTGPITPGGASVTAALTTPGQNARYTFTRAVGQRVSVKMTSVTIASSYVYLNKPDGGVLASQLVGTGGAFMDTQTLPAAGTYTVLVDPQTSNTGSMTVTLYDVPADVTGPITPGGASVTPVLSTPGQNARYTFTGAVGQRVSVRMTSVTIASSYVYLNKPDGSVFASQLVGTGGAFMDTQTLPVAGTYTVLVDPQTSNTGSMTVALYDVPADVSGSITPGGAAVTVTIGTSGQNASLTFSGTAGQRVSVKMTAVTISWSYVYLKKPDGTTQATQGVGTGGAFMDTQTLATTGTYTLFVNPDVYNTGAMTLTLYDVPADVTGSLTVNAAALTVAVGTPGQNGRVTFAGTAGQSVTVRVTSNTLSCVLAALLKPDNTQLTSSYSCASSFNLAPQTLSPTGTYAITLDPNGATTGSLSVSVTSP